MNTLWSEQIQGIKNLDLSRNLRFRDDRKDLFLNILGITSETTVLDIGCGPGTFTRKLSKWLENNANIIGIDRDINFLNYAKEQAKEHNYTITYLEGDALTLPLDENSVDACVSHTVIEHVPNKEFLLEQKRVTRPGGRVSVMFARPDHYIRTEPDQVPPTSKRETELLTKLWYDTSEIDKTYNVGKFWPDPIGLPKLFEELGFKQIIVDAISVPIAIDDARYNEQENTAIVKNEKLQLLESIAICQKNNNNLTVEEYTELKQIIGHRFNKRNELVKKGIKLWDYTITLTQIVSGTV